MKKVLTGVVALALFAAGCGGSSDSEELAQARAELAQARAQLAQARAELDALKGQIARPTGLMGTAQTPTTTDTPSTTTTAAPIATTAVPTTTVAATTTAVPTTTAAPTTTVAPTTTTMATTTTVAPTPYTREGFPPGQLSWDPKQRVVVRDLSYTEASGTDAMEFYLSSRPTAAVVLDITWDPTEVLIGSAAGGCSLPDESVMFETLRMVLGPDTWLSDAGFAMAGAGDGIDDGDQVTELRIAVVDELSDAAYRDAADLVAYVTTRNRADGAVCH